jgi:hypothetical protein
MHGEIMIKNASCWLGRAVGALVGLWLAGCGGAEPAPEGGSRSVVGDSGALVFEVTAESGPVEGANTFAVALQEVDSGAAFEGASLEVDALMPAMGHGAPGEATVEELGGGRYEARDVVLSMAGTWEVRFRASRDAVVDEAGFVYEVP